MSRYDGYSDTLEAMVAMVREQKRTNELLEQLIPKTNAIEHTSQIDGGNEHVDDKLKNTAPRKRGNGRGTSNTKR